MVTPSPLLGGLAGSAVTGGLILMVVGIRGTEVGDGRPPGAVGRWWSRFSGAGLPLALQRARRRRLGAALAVLFVLLAVTRIAALAVGGAVAAYYLPPLLAGSAATRTRIARLEGVEAWTRRLADVMTTRATLEAAVASTVRAAPSAIAEEVSALGARLAARIPTEAALRAFADAIDDPVGDMVAAALILAADRRGPRLVDVLRRLSETVAAEVALRRDLDADRQKPRSTARILTLFVLGAVAFIVLVPMFRQPYQTPVGEVVLAAVGALMAVLFMWMWQMTMAGPDGRFLNPQKGLR